MMVSRKNRGFTLVELLVVVTILALLAMLAVPGIQRASVQARKAQVAEDLQTIQEALEHYYSERGFYPRKLDDLIQHGFIKPGFRFRSPVSKHWYFYAVDENRDGKAAKAFVLGNSSKNAPSYNSSAGNDLYRSGIIPQGRPASWRAWGWIGAAPNSNLILYEADGTTQIPITQVPSNLADYRTSCQPGAATPCDLWSN
jgi:prepilin-type N-terminal cleavage/methylation domain-containing protein